MKSTSTLPQRLQLDQPAIYCIEVQGRLDPHWATWFQEMELVVSGELGCPVSSLTGRVADQAELHGLLARIRDLGLPLLLVRCVSKLRVEKETL